MRSKDLNLIELDVHLSADGELMIIHDRLTGQPTEKERKPILSIGTETI
jgi:glycerophosphoryl diester phosphodiesterase